MTENKIASFYEGAIQKRQQYLEQFNKSLSNYYNNLKYRLQVFRISKKSTDQYVASDFSFFDILRPNENTLSDIISDLLNVNGNHGQGSLFLLTFLKITGLSSNFEVNRFKNIFREDPTCYIAKSSRRIDITIDFGNKGIGIENKPWATDQFNQLEDYKNHLEKKYTSNFFLLYLSGDGHKPQSLKVPTDKLRTISYYSHIINWLTECSKESKADKIRWFLLDFIAYIKQTFPSLTNEDNDYE